MESSLEGVVSRGAPVARAWSEMSAPLAIGAGALALRLAFATQYAGHPLGRLPWVDEGAYWARAHH